MEDVQRLGDRSSPDEFRRRLPEPRSRQGMSALHQHYSKGMLTSPYEEALKRNMKTKLLNNRVYVPWFRTYKLDIANEVVTEYQPFDEIQRNDEDIALQYFYGERYLLYHDYKDPQVKQQRLAVLRMYNKKKQRDFTAQAIASGDVDSTFGPTAFEKQLMRPIVDYFHKLHTIRKRQFLARSLLKPKSKWHALHRSSVQTKLFGMAKTVKKRLAKEKFSKTVHIVLNVQKFLSVLTTMIVGDTDAMFKKDKEYTEAAEACRQQLTRRRENAKEKNLFSSQRYKMNNEIGVPLSVKFSLTKPWFRRSEQEVDEIVDCFQRLKSFVEYPISYQRLIGRAAWLMELPRYKVVIREGQQAFSFYFVVTGKLRMNRLVGDPSVTKYSEFKQVATIKSQEAFGEECIARPYSVRNYSVVTEESTTLLSVNIHEMYKMELEVNEHEEAPEHIKFLSTLSFFENFPKSKLKVEADENIMLFYFRPNMVVTPDVEHSEFVYVISWGVCEVLVEIPPRASIVEQYLATERQKLEVAARSGMRKKSSAVQLIQSINSKQVESKQKRQSTKTELLTLQSLAPLMIKPLHKKALEIDTRKTEKRLSKFKEQMNAEVTRINNKTTQVIAAITKKAHKLPEFIEEWNVKFRDHGITMPKEFLKPPKQYVLDIPSEDPEEKDGLFKIDDILNQEVASGIFSTEDLLPKESEIVMPMSTDVALESSNSKNLLNTIQLEAISQKSLNQASGVQLDVVTASSRKLDFAEETRKFEPYKHKTRKERRKAKSHKSKKGRHQELEPDLDEQRVSDQMGEVGLDVNAPSGDTSAISIADASDAKLPTHVDEPEKAKKTSRKKSRVPKAMKRQTYSQNPSKLIIVKSNKSDLARSTSARTNTDEKASKVILPKLESKKSRKSSAKKSLTRDQTNNYSEETDYVTDVNRLKPQKMFLPRNGTSTMPEISEISPEDVPRAKSTRSEMSMSSNAPLSRNNSNITSAFLPEQNTKMSVAFSKVSSTTDTTFTSSTSKEAIIFSPPVRNVTGEKRNSFFPKEPPRPPDHSRWKLRGILSRGDHLGTEWLDFNDRPYEPIEEKCALVSRGSTIIMIRKTFLLKYLRKSW